MFRNLIAFVVLNIWLVGTRKGYVTYCPGCGNASCLNRFGMKHCDVCGYHQSEVRR
jgi:uncharacterized protein (DUF983 family)